MTVLLIRNANQFDFGGGERFPVDLAQQLVAHGYQTVVVSRNQKLLAYASQKHLRTHRGWWWSHQNWGSRHLPLLPLYVAWQLLLVGWYIWLVLRYHVDVVHPQSRDDFVSATIAGKLLGKKVIWTDHADLKYIYANHRVWYRNVIGKLVFFLSKQTDAVVAVSHNELKLISESLTKPLPAHYTVIHNGVSDQPIKAVPRSAAQKSLTIFTTTSRMVAAKGIGELIEAFQLLQKNTPKTQLWLFGDGPDYDKFRALGSSNPNIAFYGFSSDPLPQVAAADVFVQPSYNEAFSISLVEAAKLGLPIIACAVGGNPEIVTNKKNGLLVPARDAASLAAAMEILAASKDLRKRFGTASRKKFEKDFVFETIVKERYLPLYETT